MMWLIIAHLTVCALALIAWALVVVVRSATCRAGAALVATRPSQGLLRKGQRSPLAGTTAPVRPGALATGWTHDY